MTTKKPCNAPERMTPAMEETLWLYHTWLAYLLRRLGERTVRVPAEELRRALTELSCTAWREGEQYVIELDTGEEAAADGVEK